MKAIEEASSNVPASWICIYGTSRGGDVALKAQRRQGAPRIAGRHATARLRGWPTLRPGGLPHRDGANSDTLSQNAWISNLPSTCPRETPDIEVPAELGPLAVGPPAWSGWAVRGRGRAVARPVLLAASMRDTMPRFAEDAGETFHYRVTGNLAHVA